MPLISVNDIDLYYKLSGQGESLLFLHGLGSSTCDWKYQTEHFSKSYRVITLDLRGHGRTEKPQGPYSIDLFTLDVTAFMQSLALGPAHVVGLSMGGMIAFQIAVDQPPLVRTLTIVNSGPAFVLPTLKLQLNFKQREWIVRLFGMKRMGKLLANKLLPEPHQKELREKFIDRWARNNPRAYTASLRALVGWSVIDRIHNIHCPTLIVSADQDYTPVTYKEAYAALVPNTEVAVISDSRHMSPLDQPEKFNCVVGEFLSKHSPPGQA